DRVRANVTREVSAAVAPPSLVIRTPCHVAAGSTVPRTTPGHCRDASAPAPSTARDAYPGPRGTIQQHDSRGHAGPADLCRRPTIAVLLPHHQSSATRLPPPPAVPRGLPAVDAASLPRIRCRPTA